MSDNIRNTSDSIDDIVKSDSDNLTEDQKKILIEASDILFCESLSRFNSLIQ